jgi:4-amino-4-deoxy-L-arabinose transferase-like glycosyltransferase
VTFFLYAYIKLAKTHETAYCYGAGIALGMALLIRPHAAIFFAFPVAIHALYLWTKENAISLKHLILFTSTSLSFVGVMLYYNYFINGSPWLSGYAKMYENDYFPERYRTLKFLEFTTLERWQKLGDDLLLAISQTQYLHTDLFGWPTSSLWGIFLLCLLRIFPRYSRLLLACFGMQLLSVLLLSRDTGWVFKPRFLYESFSSLIVLTAISLHALAHIMARYSKRHELLPAFNGAVFCLVGILTLYAMANRTTELYKEYRNNYWQGNWAYNRMLIHSVDKPALIFINPYEAYRYVYFNMPPRDDAPIIYAKDLGEKNRLLMDYYPHRHVYRADFWNLSKIRAPQ